MHRDRETSCREEVCGDAQRRGARTAQHVESQRQTPCRPAREGPHPAEGRCLRCRRGMAGEGWSDTEIAAALDTSVGTVARTRQQLVEEGFEAVLTRKHSPASATPRIFDGASEAKLIALACPAKGTRSVDGEAAGTPHEFRPYRRSQTSARPRADSVPNIGLGCRSAIEGANRMSGPRRRLASIDASVSDGRPWSFRRIVSLTANVSHCHPKDQRRLGSVGPHRTLVQPFLIGSAAAAAAGKAQPTSIERVSLARASAPL